MKWEGGSRWRLICTQVAIRVSRRKPTQHYKAVTLGLETLLESMEKILLA